ncbi:hypothetical protein NQD34_008633 [Periophthalmus magnuspinnatus]|nr:hypothetical protein NQD34_008633 [Periophthalmus magnuspinnatus]
MKLHCDTDWELNGTKCYYFSSNKLSWSHSKKKCVNMSGHLVKIDSREEQMFLSDRLKRKMREDDDKFWIGLTDSETEDVWKWTDGSSLDPNLTFWFKTKQNSEPDNWTGHNKENLNGEDCVRMGEKADGFETKCWFDQDCNSSQHYICEKNTASSPNCIK